MSNYNSVVRTNYFKVKKDEEFLDFFKKISSENGKPRLWSRENKGKREYAFGSVGELYYDGMPLHDSDFATHMQKMIPENEAVVLEEIGNEKLRYLNASAIIITSNDYAGMDFLDVLIGKAKSILQDDSFTCDMEY